MAAKKEVHRTEFVLANGTSFATAYFNAGADKAIVSRMGS